MLDCQQVANWLTVTRSCDPSWTVTSLTTCYGSGGLDNPGVSCWVRVENLNPALYSCLCTSFLSLLSPKNIKLFTTFSLILQFCLKRCYVAKHVLGLGQRHVWKVFRIVQNVLSKLWEVFGNNSSVIFKNLCTSRVISNSCTFDKFGKYRTK